MQLIEVGSWREPTTKPNRRHSFVNTHLHCRFEQPDRDASKCFFSWRTRHIATNSELILSIESAVAGGSLCLSRAGKTIAKSGGASAVSRAEDLLTNIDRLLKNADIEKSELGVVAVSVGPGSFTGLRIGISSAMGFSAALGIPCTGVNLLEAIASSVGAGERLIVAVPLGRSDLCFQLFENGSSQAPAAAGTKDDLATFVKENGRPTLAFHSSLGSLMNDLATVSASHDLGLNMAEYLVPLAAANPAGSLDPLYVQNPRFSQGV